MTLQDVARRAAVSTATASRVLRNSTSVKSATRARVQEAIETLKYNPNSHARSLATGTNRTIGVIVSNLEDPFFQDIYKAISRRAESAGYEVTVADACGNQATLAASIRIMLGRRVAGVAAIVTGMDQELTKELAEHQIPVVLYDSGSPQPSHSHPVSMTFKRGSTFGWRNILLRELFATVRHSGMSYTDGLAKCTH